MTTERVVIVGGPRCGKSTLAKAFALTGYPVFCGDPLSMVKEPFGGVTYLPEGLAMEDESTRWIVMNWFAKPGPWVCEGWIMARALRKWMTVRGEIEGYYGGGLKMADAPCDRIIVFEEQRPELTLLPGQVAMHKGVMRVWAHLADEFRKITEYL